MNQSQTFLTLLPVRSSSSKSQKHAYEDSLSERSYSVPVYTSFFQALQKWNGYYKQQNPITSKGIARPSSVRRGKKRSTLWGPSPFGQKGETIAVDTWSLTHCRPDHYRSRKGSQPLSQFERKSREHATGSMFQSFHFFKDCSFKQTTCKTFYYPGDTKP